MTRDPQHRLDLRSRSLTVAHTIVDNTPQITITATLTGPRGAHHHVIVLDTEQARGLVDELIAAVLQ